MNFDIIILVTLVFVLFLINITFKKFTPQNKCKALKLISLTLYIVCLVMIFVGSMVVSTRSGMAFIDWPTSDAKLFPAWEEWGYDTNKFYEHFHRLLGYTIGYVSIVLCLLSKKINKQLFKYSLIILFIIIFQGFLGGLTVLNKTFWLTTALHSLSAQLTLIFSLFITLKSFNVKKIHNSFLNKLSKMTATLLSIQMFIGATFRNGIKKSKEIIYNNEVSYTYIENFTGKEWDLYAHIGMTLLTAIGLSFMSIECLKDSKLKKISYAILSSLLLQVFLGVIALVSVSKRDEQGLELVSHLLSSTHVINGFILLSLSFFTFIKTKTKV